VAEEPAARFESLTPLPPQFRCGGLGLRLGQTFVVPLPSNRKKGGDEMFGTLYDKADWAVGALLVVAMAATVAALFA
jgi:hypothetical protein